MEIKVKHLTKEEFAEYGQFNDMLDSGRAGFGTEAFTFYRDCVRYATQAPVLGMSTLSVKKDERFQLQALEYHNYASEVMMMQFFSLRRREVQRSRRKMRWKHSLFRKM